MSKRDFYIRESEMDDFQRQVINRRSESSLIVRGCAGSGKSVIAFWRLHDIVSNNKGTAQIIVFTRSLKDYFVEGCRGEGIDPNLIDYWANWSRHPKVTDYILIDEAQDFSRASIEMFQSYARKALLLYGDTSQQIYSFKTGRDAPMSMEDIKGLTRFPDDQLVFNHRLPKTIARLAEHLNVEHDDLVNRCRNEGDEKPYVLRYPTREDQLMAIAHIVQTRSLDDVGIFFPTNEQAKTAWQFMDSRGFNFEVKYSENQTIYSNINFATSNPKIFTYHSAKGLQFETVFLPEMENMKLTRFLEPLYVAMTRAYQSLFIMYSGELPQVLRKIPTDLYETDLRTRETEVL